MAEATVIGWDIGGAHVKACLLQRGRVIDVAQWTCPLWQGIEHLERALQSARERWPAAARARHAVTMTGEMVDLFEHREEGVQRIAALLCDAWPEAPPLQFFAGDRGWCGRERVAGEWAHIASANWLATALHAARELDGFQREGVLVDIGSTTTDIIAFKGGRVVTQARSDVQRLATGELVYQGVVRTPLCGLARQIPWRGQPLNVMNEYFATVADVYRLTGELDAAHDLYPSADNAPKDAAATRKRLARMIGMDARDASDAEWLLFAQDWRAAQVAELGTQLQRVMAMHALSADAVVVSAGCGDFLVADVLAQAHGAACACRSYGADLARLGAGAAPDATRWAQVCAPSVAVAMLLDMELR
ncbi:hydantoinase/oxoprolinase family protein [Rhizobacter sp. SG703]|uniref:hydantoinase/oxoprolinase family protein n=1 Tax=Rhizobacter sp. SG703 TaxID=2587140 RepID=UPI001446277E|nr:hydantoinase/oxoprolinase family protein [Rhizobacter sp. SG703]NKI97876.1 putative H4MPT-linked C1 transfer pathway protein [Rhizobacter sp. SG703]